MHRKLQLFLIILLAANNIIAQNSSNVDTNERRFSVTANAGFVYSYRNVDERVQSATMNYRNNNDVFGKNFTIGLNIGYRFSKNWSALLGASFTQYGFETKNIQITIDTNGGSSFLWEFVNPVAEAAGTSPIEKNLGFIYNGYHDHRYFSILKMNTGPEGTVKYNIEYNYLDIPLALKYNFYTKNNISCFMNFGLNLNFMLRAKFKSSFELKTLEGEKFTEIIENTHLPSDPENYLGLTHMSTFNISPFLSLGSDYKINDSWTASVFIDANYMLRNTFQTGYYDLNGNEVYREHLYNLALKGSVTRFF